MCDVCKKKNLISVYLSIYICSFLSFSIWFSALVLYVFKLHTFIQIRCNFSKMLRVQGPKGTILFPRSETKANGSWLLTVSHKHTVLLTFAKFPLYHKDMPDIATTQLQVWDGKNDHAFFIGSFRGTKRPFSLQLSGRHLLVRLTVESDIPLCNFKGYYVSTTTKGIIQGVSYLRGFKKPPLPATFEENRHVGMFDSI